MVIIHNNKLRISTLSIAKGFQREHKNILRLIKKYRNNFKNFGHLEINKRSSTGGRPVIEYLLDKAQCLLLAGLFKKQTDKHIIFFTTLIQHFDKADKSLKEILQALDAFDFDNIDVRYIYAAQDNLGRLKIGISNNPKRRLKELNIGNADELKLVYVKDTVKSRYGDEVDIHNNASGYCIKGEWFKPEAVQFLQ